MYEIVDDITWYEILYTAYEKHMGKRYNNNYNIDFIQNWIANQNDNFGRHSN